MEVHEETAGTPTKARLTPANYNRLAKSTPEPEWFIKGALVEKQL